MNTKYTHYLQYQQRDGSWRDGGMAFTLDEARAVARASRLRTGRAVRVRRIPVDTDTCGHGVPIADDCGGCDHENQWSDDQPVSDFCDH